MSRFHLDKWYLDVIDSRGRAVVGYAATLRLGTLEIGYMSVLVKALGAPAVARSTFRNVTLPMQTEDNTVLWTAPRFGVDARYRPLCRPLSATLYADADAAVEWTCLAPRAEVELTLGHESIRGLGYVERLSLGVAPWKLPIEELRWGRAISAEQAVTWIDWRGTAHQRTLVAVDERIVPGTVDDVGVASEGTRLVDFEEVSVLREGVLERTALSHIPSALRQLLPKNALGLDERKFVGTARMNGATAQAIWEVVRWPKRLVG